MHVPSLGLLGTAVFSGRYLLFLEVLQNGGSIVSMPHREGLPFPIVTSYVHLYFH